MDLGAGGAQRSRALAVAPADRLREGWPEAARTGTSRLLEGMPQRALKPNVISYTAATSACEKGGQWQCALELLEGMPQ